MTPGAPIGDGFVARQPDGSITGVGQYCGFPIALRLEPDERDGQRGYRVTLHQAGDAQRGAE